MYPEYGWIGYIVINLFTAKVFPFHSHPKLTTVGTHPYKGVGYLSSIVMPAPGLMLTSLDFV